MLEHTLPYLPPNITEISLKVHGDERGSLIALENGHNLPFDVKRVYYIFGTQNGVTRGLHAHKNLRQLLIATSGSVEIHCEIKGKQKVFVLDRPDKGLLVEGLVWREMKNFSLNAVLMVLASEYYSEADYIRCHKEFSELEKL